MANTAAKTAQKLKTPDKSKKKMLLTVTGTAVLLIAAVIALILLSRSAPPDPQQNPLDAKKFMATKDFKRMSNPEKLAYVAKFGNERGLFRPDDKDLTDAERAQLRDNMRSLFEAQMRERLNKFFAASKEDQNKMLDEDIKRDAERDQQKQANGGGPGGPDGGPPPDGKGGTPPSPPSAQEQRNHEASASPTAHAQMQVYMTMKQQRKSSQ